MVKHTSAEGVLTICGQLVLKGSHYRRHPGAALRSQAQDQAPGSWLCMALSGESEAEASSCPGARALSTLGDVPVAFLIAVIVVLSQRTHYIAQFLPNLLQCLLGNQQFAQAFPDTVSRGLIFSFPFPSCLSFKKWLRSQHTMAKPVSLTR